jgi:hypothetical protein
MASFTASAHRLPIVNFVSQKFPDTKSEFPRNIKKM